LARLSQSVSGKSEELARTEGDVSGAMRCSGPCGQIEHRPDGELGYVEAPDDDADALRGRIVLVNRHAV